MQKVIKVVQKIRVCLQVNAEQFNFVFRKYKNTSKTHLICIEIAKM